MGENKKNKQSMISICEQIEEHFEKLENAKNIWNDNLVRYYKTEIEVKFIWELYKKSKKTKMSENIQEKILFYKEKLKWY